MSDYLSEEDDEQIEANYERADDRSIKDLSVSSNAALSYADGWKSAAPLSTPTFFSTEIRRAGNSLTSYQISL